MNTRSSSFSIFVGIVIGCASTSATQVPTADAEPAVAPEVQPAGAFRECVNYRLDSDEDHDDLAENAKRITGWTPVGGFQDGVVLCR